MIRSQVWLLVGKELRQLTRNRNAVVSGLVFPIMMLVLIPSIQLAAAGGGSGGGITGAELPGLNAATSSAGVFLYLVFPLFYVLCGLLTPGVSATYTTVAEREQRTLELLMALPVTVREILTAKLISNLLSAAATMLPLFVVNAVLIQIRADAGLAYIFSALVLLLSALACSVGIGLFLALVARDQRTAGNLTALWLLPAMALTGIDVVFVPGLWRFYALAAVLLLFLIALMVFCLRWLTFERYLS